MYILILIIAGHGVNSIATNSVEFQTLLTCNKAQKRVVKMKVDDYTKVTAICVKKITGE